MGGLTENRRPELVIALVGAVGARLDDLAKELKASLAKFGYDAVDIRLSSLLRQFTGWHDQAAPGEFARIRNLQDVGNAMRQKAGSGASLALACIADIRRHRAATTGSADKSVPNCAYILHQLKHPQEADLLRQVYGSNFLLVAGHQPKKQRAKELADRLARVDGAIVTPEYERKASELIEIDEKQEDELGQNTRDTYPKADFFANLGLQGGHQEVGRFIDLIFGHPFRTPSPDEYAMYQASAVALRSSDDARQVGAAVVDLTRDQAGTIVNADVVASGMNEVPRGGGGFYWDKESPDERDQWQLAYRNVDRAKELKTSALTELLDKVRIKGWLSDAAATRSSGDLAKDILADLKRTQFMNIGEFGRTVHAEMASIIDAARRGVPISGRSMYVTTFPCHNCAKHIIAVGIKRVVYLEPYPKSRASILHGEEMDLDSVDGKELPGKVVFVAFSGVAPRQYKQLFSIAERGREKGLPLTKWQDSTKALSPLYVARNSSSAYLTSEREELRALPDSLYHWDRAKLLPKTK